MKEIFFINPTIKRIIITFPFGIQFISYSLDYFLKSKLFFIFFLQFFFVKRSNNFFTVKITNNICSRHSILNFFNHKNFFWPIWYLFEKMSLYFDILTWFATSKLGFSLLFALLKSKYVLDFTSAGSILIVQCIYYCIYLLCHLIYQYTHFLILKSHICKLYSLRF